MNTMTRLPMIFQESFDCEHYDLSNSICNLSSLYCIWLTLKQAICFIQESVGKYIYVIGSTKPCFITSK